MGCIASECMAWRQRKQYRERSDKAWTFEFPGSGPNVEERFVGHCGLAGSP